MSQSDLTFFTNESGATLLERFKATLKDTKLFDVLVGYFRASGFYQLHESIVPINKTRILIGLGIDNESYQILDSYQNQAIFDFESHSKTKKSFQCQLIHEVENSVEPDNKLEIGLIKFIEFLQTECFDLEEDRKLGGNGKKLEIRAFPSTKYPCKSLYWSLCSR